MNIGMGCFKDPEIRSMIISVHKRGKCNITGKDTYVFDTDHDLISEEIADDISQVLDVYSPESDLPIGYDKSKLDLIENHLYTDWGIFSVKPGEIRKIVIELCKANYSSSHAIFHEKVGIEKMNDLTFLRENCIVRDSSWENFSKTIKNINRFHVSDVNLDILRDVLNAESLNLTIPCGTTELYRARISGENPLAISEMGPPPIDKVTPGRANSRGIPCLYVAEDVETTFHEIRARDLDYVSVGNFKCVEELNMVDLTGLDHISPFSMPTFSMEWFSINMSILIKISEEIAKPLRRTDSELDYLPSQYIADFIKSLGFDGMRYKSTLHMGGINEAIFNPDKLECQSVTLYHIKALKYRHKIM